MLAEGWLKVGSVMAEGQFWLNVGSVLADGWLMVGSMLADGWLSECWLMFVVTECCSCLT